MLLDQQREIIQKQLFQHLNYLVQTKVRDTAERKGKNHWCRFSLRRLLVVCAALSLVIGLVSLQQQRQKKYLRIVEFVERAFDSGGVIPNEVARNANPEHTKINGNRFVSSVAHSPNNGPAFISSEHELIYRPSSNGSRLADVTIKTSWHCLRSKPKVSISNGGGIFDSIAVARLKQMLGEKFDVKAIEFSISR